MQEPITDAIHFTKEDKISLLQIARNAIKTYVQEEKVLLPQELGVYISKAMERMCGVFVTLHTFTSAHNDKQMQLRGCIGYIWTSLPLYHSVIENAISAACRDYRFQPLSLNELSNVNIEISVLTPPKRAATLDDIRLGEDGIIIYKDNRQAVFLPKVASQFGWDLAETLTQLSLKAGLAGNAWRNGAQFDVFQAQVFAEHDIS